VLNLNSLFNIELNGTTAGTQYDQLAVNGTVNLGSAALNVTLGFIPGPGAVFKIIDNDGTGDAVTGTFNTISEGDTVTFSGTQFIVSYKGGDGNDVTLTRPGVATPPPQVNNGSLVIDDGSGITVNGVVGTQQRSMVRRMILSFDSTVSFSG